MAYKTDIEIAQENTIFPIEEIAKNLEIPLEFVEHYGKHKAKIALDILKDSNKKEGKLILVTAMSPTPLGEGKTTTSVGLADALAKLGKKVVTALREPSLGPVFGRKGGATGGGYAQVVPMEDINLHFTGDFHAISAANNLLAAMLDNHIYQGNALNIDPSTITWKRAVDMNDRQLRFIVSGLGGKINGRTREDGFDISVASEIMAILCLATSIDDLKERFSKIIVAYNYNNEPVAAGQLKAQGAMAALLKEAIKPNLAQSLEHTPSLIHGGPFANIAHGCNSVLATKMALKLSDYAVTEAGFGADLGAEKFIDIKCRLANLQPAAVVIVATIKALKFHGGIDKDALSEENLVALAAGLPNLLQHIDNMQNVFGLPAVVAINKFPTDSAAELNFVKEACAQKGVSACLSEVWEKGGEGGLELAQKVVELVENDSTLSFAYALEDSIEQKIEHIVQKVYRGDKVIFTPQAKKQIEKFEALGFGNMPICMAKTQYSFSDNAKRLGAPRGFSITIRDLKISAGAGFIVALVGEIMTMPGLPKIPNAEGIDIDNEGKISGLF